MFRLRNSSSFGPEIGTSREAWLTASTIYMNRWFQLVYEDSVTSFGLVSDMARTSLAANGVYDGSSRWNLTATMVLGDPEVDIYTNAVIDMDVAHAGSLELGQDSFPVTITSAGDPVMGAVVTLVKAGEAFASDTTDAGGTADLFLLAETTGDATLTAHKSYYRVHEG